MDEHEKGETPQAGPALPPAAEDEVLLLRARELELKYIIGVGQEKPADLARLVKEWLEE